MINTIKSTNLSTDIKAYNIRDKCIFPQYSTGTYPHRLWIKNNPQWTFVEKI